MEGPSTTTPRTGCTRRRIAWLSNDIPEPLRFAHVEARKCLRGKGYTAAVAVCGTTLEGACELQGVKGRTLQSSLDKMKANGLIDDRLTECADQLRGRGKVRRPLQLGPDHTTGRRGLDRVSEVLLENLYVLTARFNAMKLRRAT